MKNLLKGLVAALLVLFGCALLTTGVSAQSTFVYTNNNAVGPNSVSAFSVDANGTLTPLAGSPFLTGENGFSGAGELTQTSRIAVTSAPGNFLYAANDLSANVSGFSIDAVTGALTPIPGSPFATGSANLGISLAVTPDGRFLYAGNNNSSAAPSISAFSIASNGALTPIAGSPFPALGFPNNMVVTPDGKFLAVAEGQHVAMFSIGSNGVPTTVPGSPFAFTAQCLDVNCASNLLFAPTLDFNNGGVSVLNIASDGGLTAIAGSRFTFPGSVSLADTLSQDGQHLFVSNLFSSNITSLNVAAGGSLTQVSPPFSVGTATPVTMATNQAGMLLYVVGLPAVGTISSVIGFSIDSNGALSPVPGSPFSTGIASPLPSIAVFPPKSCCPAPVISNVSASPDVLWPPNHKKVEVAVNYDVVEPCSFSCTLNVASNEPADREEDDGDRDCRASRKEHDDDDGDTPRECRADRKDNDDTRHDWRVLDANHVLLRSEKEGKGSGRIYTITVSCTNSAGKSSSQSVTVSVPHDQRAKHLKGRRN